jgi:hypothetical protein
MIMGKVSLLFLTHARAAVSFGIKVSRHSFGILHPKCVGQNVIGLNLSLEDLSNHHPMVSCIIATSGGHVSQ